MKKAIVFLFLIIAVSADAQSLKDLLYSGKLKKDSNVVIRKGDDLSSRIDTGQKKPAEQEIAKNTTTPGDSSVKKLNPLTDSSTATTGIEDSTAVVSPDVIDKNAVAKNNNQIL